MSSRSGNSTVYLGLFLIGFALYGSQTIPSAEPMGTPTSTTEEPRPKPVAVARNAAEKLNLLYKKIHADSLFTQHVDGLVLEYMENAIRISMTSDEIYESGEFSIRDSWLKVFDRFAEMLGPEQKSGLLIKVHSYTDSELPLEARRGDFGPSDFSLSVMRAEWAARYLQRQWNYDLKQKVELVGHGAIPHGKRIDLELSYL